MRNWITILVLCLCAHVALGGIIVSSPDSGWYNQNWREGEEYRWGATLRNMDYTNGDWELGIGNTPEMTEGGPMQADFNWNAGTTYSFDLSYDSTTEQATWTVEGTSVALQNPTALFSDLYIQLKGRPETARAYMSVSNTMIAVEGSVVASIDDFAAGYGEADELSYIHINHSDEPLSEMDFVLAGTLYIDWTGETPIRDEMGSHINMTQIPEPASIIMVILVSVTGLFIRRRFR